MAHSVTQDCVVRKRHGCHRDGGYLRLDGRGLALRRRRAGSVFPARRRLVHEGRTGCLVMDALMMAVWRRGKADALLHHSDQGSQYASEQFQHLLADNAITCSINRAGNVWDNSAMESFFSSLKTERTARKVYRTRDEARADVFDYIERFYNPSRRHSALGGKNPLAFDRPAAQTRNRSGINTRQGQIGGAGAAAHRGSLRRSWPVPASL